MKPNFALDLSHDGIGLVHRGKGGWVLVGEVSLDHPDLTGGLDLLRRKAADLESGGFSCKLIIPGSQLLFTSMIAPGPDDDTRLTRIREGLEGLTPYDVKDLVFDWRADTDDDGMVHVAVVARETLDEAEAFANDHKLNPVSFVARPSGSFTGEAFFGPVKSAVATGGAPVERDDLGVPEVLGPVPDDPQAGAGDPQTPAEAESTDKAVTPAAALPELAPFPPTPDMATPTAPPPAKPDDAAKPEARAPDPGRDVEPAAKPAAAMRDDKTPDLTKTAESEPPSTPEPTVKHPAAETGDDAPGKDAAGDTPDVPGKKISGIVPPPPPPVSPDRAQGPTGGAPTFSSRRAEDPAPKETAPDPAGIEVKPRLSFGVERDATQEKPASAPTSGPASGPTPDEPPAPPTVPAPKPKAKPVHVPVTAPVAFGDDPALAADAESKPEGKKTPPLSGDRKSAEKLSTAARKGAAGLASAADAAGRFGRKAARKIEDRRRDKVDQIKAARPKVTIPALRKAPQPKDTDASDTAIAPPPPRLGDAGRSAKAPRSARTPSPRAREAETMTVFGARKTQTVGGKPRYLGLYLVLGLILLMAIVAIWSMFFLNDSTAWLFPEREDPFEAAISTDPDTDPSEALTQEDELDDINAALEEDAAQTGQAVDGRNPLTPEAAQARYAATGIWQRAPEPMASPETTDLDDLYIASIDPDTIAQDAIALPDAGLPAGAAAAISTAPPPPLGTTFTLDSDGLVVPTPEGALSPEGITVFAGRPVLVPAPRPGSEDTAPVAEETADATPTLPRIRPRARPEGLVEGNERLQLGGRTRTELAVLRPRVRPTTPRASAQAAAITAALQAAGDPAANDEAGNPSTAGIIAPTEQAIVTSLEPRHRPSGFNRIVARTNAARDDASDGSVAVAAASAQQSVTPSIPTRASVASQATIKNAINLRKISLIGIYGSSSARRALVRLPSGRYQKVGVGSRLDGGQVLSISATALVYKKGSRSITLEVLPFS